MGRFRRKTAGGEGITTQDTKSTNPDTLFLDPADLPHLPALAMLSLCRQWAGRKQGVSSPHSPPLIPRRLGGKV